MFTPQRRTVFVCNLQKRGALLYPDRFVGSKFTKGVVVRLHSGTPYSRLSTIELAPNFPGLLMLCTHPSPAIKMSSKLLCSVTSLLPTYSFRMVLSYSVFDLLKSPVELIRVLAVPFFSVSSLFA